MEVQTYEIEETTSDLAAPAQVEAEALQLIESLGLEGQKSLIKEKDDGQKVRQPYPEMNAEERAVYGELYERVVDYRKYDAGIIPVRVLQVIGHAKTLFEHVEVWCPRQHDPDPILVGWNGKDVYSRKAVYLLARWGDALAAFAELKERAVRKLKERWTSQLNETVTTAQGQLATLDALVAKKLRGEYVGI